jgi:kynurenine formamidase
MHRGIIMGLCLTAGSVVAGLMEYCESSSAASPGRAAPFTTAAQAAEPARLATLESLCNGQLKVLDLTWPLNRASAYWPGPDYKPFELHTLATLEKNGVLSQAYSTPEHLGTHIDAPNHFEAAGISVDQINPQDLFAPGVVIDVSDAAAQDPDYRLKLEDLLQWEHKHGQVPPHAVVLLNTGWGRHWSQQDRYQGADVMGRLHFPGFSAAAIRFLLKERQIRGVGIDTLSVDYGLSRDFEVHHLLGAAGRYGLENVAHLDQLPARDFYLVVAPIKIESGSGGQTRVIAILP